MDFLDFLRAVVENNTFLALSRFSHYCTGVREINDFPCPWARHGLVITQGDAIGGTPGIAPTHSPIPHII